VGHLDHGFAILVVCFSVESRMARDLAPRASVIVYAPQIVAVGHGREGAVEWKYFQPVPRQIEFANDFRPE
jgi:hypothetical protein